MGQPIAGSSARARSRPAESSGLAAPGEHVIRATPLPNIDADDPQALGHEDCPAAFIPKWSDAARGRRPGRTLIAPYSGAGNDTILVCTTLSRPREGAEIGFEELGGREAQAKLLDL